MTHSTIYGQFCPLARASEILAPKWTPLILRELAQGSTSFNDIHRGVPQMSRSMLAVRLKQLEDYKVVSGETAGRGQRSVYRLTERGIQLLPALLILAHWGQTQMAAFIRDDELNVSYLMWDIHRSLNVAGLPDRPRIMIQFDIENAYPDRPTWWMIAESGDVELCLKDPGLEADIWVGAANRPLTEVWLGQRPLDPALEDGTNRLHGQQDIIRSFRDWFRVPTLPEPH